MLAVCKTIGDVCYGRFHACEVVKSIPEVIEMDNAAIGSVGEGCEVDCSAIGCVPITETGVFRSVSMVPLIYNIYVVVATTGLCGGSRGYRGGGMQNCFVVL